MKLVIQRVTSSSVVVDDNVVGQIGKGLMVLVGFGENDTQREADYLAGKLVKRFGVTDEAHAKFMEKAAGFLDFVNSGSFSNKKKK